MSGVEISFEFIARHPAAIMILGGILLLFFSELNDNFAGWGWSLIVLGAILQVLWLFLFRRI